MKNIVTILGATIIASFLFTSCGQNSNKQKELELKERELALKEKEFALKEKGIHMDNSKNSKIVDNETINQNKVQPLAKTKIVDKPIDIKRLIANKLLIDFKTIKQSCSVDDIVKSIRINSISLNPNGQQYIVELWGCNGTDDCADNWIYEFKNNNLLLLVDLECTSITARKVHKVKTNGYFDFELTEPQHMSIITSFYRFNGTQYKRTSFTEKPNNN